MSISVAGDRTSGAEVRTQNVTAAVSIANIVRTSLGPLGLDKMIVDDVGDVLITNDGATMLAKLEVEHPAAKILVQLSDMQDQEVGDGTTSVVIVAAELLRRANDLIRLKIHPTSVISGYRQAAREGCRFLKKNMIRKIKVKDDESVLKIARTTMASKIIGAEEDVFAHIVVDAMKSVRTKKGKYPLSNVSILKAHGRSSGESFVVPGFALNCTRAALGMPTKVENAKIALLDFNLNRSRLQVGIQVHITDVDNLEAVRQQEIEMTKLRITKMLDAGANVILTTGGIDDLNQKYFVDAGAMAVRRVKPEDLRKIAKATGGDVCLSMANLDGDEEFLPEWLGQAEVVEEIAICDDHVILIKHPATTASTSIMLRGPNEQMLDEMERSVHDALCTVKRTLESKKVVPGGGACEAALKVHLENYALTVPGREQEAIMQFADALLVIPKTLANNAAKDATELTAELVEAQVSGQRRLYSEFEPIRAAAREAGEKEPKVPEDYKIFYGLDLVKGQIRNNLDAGVLEPALVKLKLLQFATEAAITVLRIDDLFKMNPPQQQQR